MMRRPTPAAMLYAWHRAALAGEEPAIHPDHPECGWYKRRMVKGGPWVPVRIHVVREIDPETGELTAPERLVADCDGRIEDAALHWTHLIPISRKDHDALVHRIGLTPEMTDNTRPLDLTKEPMRWMT